MSRYRSYDWRMQTQKKTEEMLSQYFNSTKLTNSGKTNSKRRLFSNLFKDRSFTIVGNIVSNLKVAFSTCIKTITITLTHHQNLRIYASLFLTALKYNDTKFKNEQKKQNCNIPPPLACTTLSGIRSRLK